MNLTDIRPKKSKVDVYCANMDFEECIEIQVLDGDVENAEMWKGIKSNKLLKNDFDRESDESC